MACRWFTILATLSLTSLGANKFTPNLPRNGRPFQPEQAFNTNDNFYLSAFFGMVVEKPSSWHAMTSDELDPLTQSVAAPELANSNNLPEKSLRRAKNGLVPLFGFMTHPPDTQFFKVNANIVALAENISNTVSGQEACDSRRAGGLRESRQMTVIYRGKCHKEEINGMFYAVEESIWNMQDAVIVQQIQFIRNTDDGFLLTFTLSYGNECDKRLLLRIMNTVYFTKK